MANREENYRHSSNRHHHDERRRRDHPNYHEGRNFNDFGSRWGEPEPRFSPHPDEWREDEMQSRNNRRRDPAADWRPFEHNREENRRHNQRHEGEQDHYREPRWRQQDRHFNPSNQHANDRWQNDESMPHPEQEQRRFHEEERRRRHRRRE